VNCKDAAELIPDYVVLGLADDLRVALDLHLNRCPACSSTVSMWHELGSIPPDRPPDSLHAGAKLLVEAYRAGLVHPSGSDWKRNRPLIPWLFAAAAAAAIALVAGIGLGRGLAGTRDTQQIADLRQELTASHRLVALALLEPQLASDRLRGVTWATPYSHTDPEVRGALLHALEADPSVDVRLAALDALRARLNDPDVRAGFIDSFAPGQSPLVQISLIDAFVAARDAKALDRIREVAARPGINPLVVQRLGWAERQVSAGGQS
jgi:hypothetical protein